MPEPQTLVILLAGILVLSLQHRMLPPSERIHEDNSCIIRGDRRFIGRVGRDRDRVIDFNTASIHTPLPLGLTVDGVTAYFSATCQGFSIQVTVQSIGILPAGFSGLGIAPNSLLLADLLGSSLIP